MFESLPIYAWLAPVALCGAAGFVWYKRRRALRIDRRSAHYLRAIGKLEKEAPVELPKPVEPPKPIEQPRPVVVAAPPIAFEPDPYEAPLFEDEIDLLEPEAPKPARAKIDAGAALSTLTAPFARFKSKGGTEPTEGKLQALTKTVTRGAMLPKIYERGLVMLYRPPESLERGAKPEFLLPWVIAQARGSDVAPAYKNLSQKEVRLVELTLESVTAGDRAFTTLKARVNAAERAFLDQLRPMAKADARETLEQLRRGMKSRVDRLLAATAANSSAPPPVQQEQARRAFLHASEMLYWLPATNDRDLWHILIGGLDFSEESMLGVVKWIIEQPCDQATAALALIRIGAEDEAGYESIRGRFGRGAEVWTIAKTICERARDDHYPTRELNLACVGEDNDQSTYAAKLITAAGEHSLPWPDPSELFAKPFDGRDAHCARFELIGDTLYHRSGIAA